MSTTQIQCSLPSATFFKLPEMVNMALQYINWPQLLVASKLMKGMQCYVCKHVSVIINHLLSKYFPILTLPMFWQALTLCKGAICGELPLALLKYNSQDLIVGGVCEIYSADCSQTNIIIFIESQGYILNDFHDHNLDELKAHDGMQCLRFQNRKDKVFTQSQHICCYS